MIDPELRERAVVTPRLLRQFAGLSLLLFGSLSLVEAFGRHRGGLAIVYALLAVGVGLPGLVRPTSIRPIFTMAVALTTPIGRIVSRLLLAVIFHVVFTPIAFVFRMTRRDSLLRRHEPDARTYWRTWQQPSEARSYLHQS
jgi:Saxitoxin biosynthesis operon protein SxtJ